MAQELHWHFPEELPTREDELLIQVSGFKTCHYIIGKYDGEFWWQHLPWHGELMPTDGWCGLGDLKILRWTYIVD